MNADTVALSDMRRVNLNSIWSRAMKVLGVLILLVALVVGIGFYRGWFSMSTQNGDAENHKTEVNLTVDRDKMEADADAVKGEVQELTGKAKEKANQLVQPDTETPQSEK